MTKVYCDICKEEISTLGAIGRIKIRTAFDANSLLADHRNVCPKCFEKWKGAVVIASFPVPCEACGGWKHEARAKPQTEIHARPECAFQYCPTPHGCIANDQCQQQRAKG